MFKVGDVIVHKRDICKITAINKKYRDNLDFYSLTPINDSSLVIHTPVDNEHGLIRKIISRKDAEILLEKIPEIAAIETVDKPNDRSIDNLYNNLISSGKLTDLVVIIKTAHSRKEVKTKNGQKASEKDKNYLNLAEKLLYNELSFALSTTYDEIRTRVINKLVSNN